MAHERGLQFGQPNPNWKPSAFKLTTPIVLQDRVVPVREWIVHNWIPHGQVTMLGGDGGIGKTLVAQQLLTACAIGRDWLGLPTASFKAIGFFCEDDEEELWRRQVAINTHYGVEFGDLDDMAWKTFIGVDATLVEFGPYYEAPTTTEVFAQILETALKFGAQLIVLDSLHDFFNGNENNRGHARFFINRLRDLAVGIDGAVVLTSHPSLSGLQSGSGFSGSTAWNNAVRSRLYLQRPGGENGDDEEDQRELKAMKTNYTRAGSSLKIAWREGVFVTTEAPTGIFAGMEKRKAEAAFLELLKATAAEGRPVSDNSRAGNYAPKLYSGRPDRQGFTRTDFHRAMEGLFAAGVLGIEEYGRASDSRKKIVQINEVEL